MPMPLVRLTALPALLFPLCQLAIANNNTLPDLLFQADDVLEVTITAPMTTLLRERPFEDELPAKFDYRNSAGEAVSFDIKIKTRGHFRRDRDICKIPPIRLNFKKSETKNTLFHKQDKVKLVTHCQRSKHYEGVVLREYVTYRLLNVLTENSFRARLLRITYVDSEGEKADTTRFGFIIEHKDRLAKRLDTAVLETKAVTVRALQPDYTNLISMFHYMIGNTDFSPIQGAEGELCCHNHVLFDNQETPILSVPYDFDQAGLVDAPHAGPAARFKLNNVRERLYRGRCSNNEQLDATIALYIERKDALVAELANLDMAAPRWIRIMTNYLERFYKTLGSEKAVNREIVKKCI